MSGSDGPPPGYLKLIPDFMTLGMGLLVGWRGADQEVAAISELKNMQMLKWCTHLRAEDLVEKLDGLGD